MSAQQEPAVEGDYEEYSDEEDYEGEEELDELEDVLEDGLVDAGAASDYGSEEEIDADEGEGCRGASRLAGGPMCVRQPQSKCVGMRSLCGVVWQLVCV